MSALIWWLSSFDCAVLAEALHNRPSLLPSHIADAFESRRGRAGRGRLWPVEGLDPVEVTCAAERWDSPIGKVLSEGHGGIVIDAADLGAVWDLPGIVTDLQIVRAGKPAPGNAAAVIEDGMIVIRVAIDALPDCLKLNSNMPTDDSGNALYTVTDAAALASEIVEVLTDNHDSNDDMISDMFDAAMLEAFENGSEGIAPIGARAEVEATET